MEMITLIRSMDCPERGSCYKAQAACALALLLSFLAFLPSAAAARKNKESAGEDAEIVFFMIGSFATKAKAAIDYMRAKGIRVGLIRPRLLRPYPDLDIVRALQGKKGVAVVDQNISVGKGGILYSELASVLYNAAGRPGVLVSFIGGLGGRDISNEDFFEMAKVTARAAETGEVPPPRLLYTREELAQMRGLQAIAATQEERE